MDKTMGGGGGIGDAVAYVQGDVRDSEERMRREMQSMQFDILSKISAQLKEINERIENLEVVVLDLAEKNEK